jgi:phage-related protein
LPQIGIDNKKMYAIFGILRKYMKSLSWIGSSQKDLAKLPSDVEQEIRYILYLVTMGKYHKNIKPFKGLGTGVYEIVSDYNKSTYRAIYVVNLGSTIYVLHVFQKKSKTGIKTPKKEVALAEQRLKQLKAFLQKEK